MHEEWTLRQGPWRAVVSPYGASLRQLWVEGPDGPEEVLWGYAGTERKKGGQGDVLIPFPGRVRDGRYSFGGVRHQLAANDKEGPNAIHGFVRSKVWDGSGEGAQASFRTTIAPGDHPGYPFSLEVLLAYELAPGGLACAFVLHNTGDGPAPVGAGFHPYIMGDLATMPLRVPAGKLVRYEGLLPTGEVEDVPPELDFREARPVGDLRLNHCLTGLEPDADGFTRIQAGPTEVWMGPAFRSVVLYTGDALGPDARRALAVEPMTCSTDALNHPDWGLQVLEPGGVFSGTWGVARRPEGGVRPLRRAPAAPGPR